MFKAKRGWLSRINVSVNNPISVSIQSKLINYFTIVLISIILYYTFVNYIQNYLDLVLIDFLLILALSINLFAFSALKSLDLSGTVILQICVMILNMLLIYGGINGTGIIWFAILPPLIYIFKGRVLGSWWMVTVFVNIFIIIWLNDQHIIKIPYSSTSLLILVVCLIALSAIIYFYQLINDRNFENIEYKKDILNGVINQLGKETRYRKQKELELLEQNELYQDSQRAILNILEDLHLEKDNLSVEKEKISKILQSIGDAVVAIDNKHKITVFNKVAADITGYNEKRAIGSKYGSILNFISEDSNRPNTSFIQKTLEGRKIYKMPNNTLLLNKKGDKIPVADSVAHILNNQNEIDGCVLVFRNTTEERYLDRAKTEFVSLASHQLQTPLSAMNWYLEMLLNGDAGKLNDEQKDYVNEIAQSNRRMVDLVNSLLNVSRLEMGTFKVEPAITNIKEIIMVNLKELKHKIDEKKLKISMLIDEDFPDVNMDQKLTNVIFQNLLSNAVKYTPAKGKVEISLHNIGNEFEFEVKDSGYGIPEEAQKKIFTKLYRADNVKAINVDGNGLGLYIVKSIVDFTGGKIWFESVQNVGTTFHVKFPLSGMKKKNGTKSLN